ncbi:citrate synthase [Candidatus Bathyarchaeota archaeon]|nr:citrate synthase [Candidatus Bathyarchaeota archaeon]
MVHKNWIFELFRKMSDDTVYARGLRDVAACQTRISFVDPLGALYYSGYDIDRLIGRVCFEEVVYLLLNNKLPNQSQLDTIKSTLISEMKIPKHVITCLKHTNKKSHPMENMRTAVSQLGEYDSNPDDNSEAANKQRALKLIAKVPTIVAALHRVRNKQDLISPKKEYGLPENFLYMFRGKPPDEEETNALDSFMILHADHGLNASTFAARVTASTFSDMYSAATSAIGTLRGKLHGGASERVMGMLLNVDNLGEIDAYIKGMLFDGKKIMGFGHRIYRVEDPRSSHLRKVGRLLCQRINRMELYRKCRMIQDVVHKERKIYPNVDFYAAIVLNALGVPKEFFTPFFASSRIAGWAAHILEQYSESVLIRPTSGYLGAYGTKFVPIEKR